MATTGALHAGGRVLLPIRRSPSAAWSNVRCHLHSTKPPSSPLPPTPPPPPPPPSPAASSRFAPAFAPPAGRRSGSIGSGVVAWYLGSIEARPVLTKSITAAAIFTVADLTSQMITLGSEESLDLIRTLRMASYGMLISGPTLHFWFNFVSKVFPKKDVANTFKKMFLGQAVYGPIINCVFFSYNAGLQDSFQNLKNDNFVQPDTTRTVRAGNATLVITVYLPVRPTMSVADKFVKLDKDISGQNGETIPEIIARLKRDLFPTIKSGLIYWPLCDFITFKFIPVHLQPLMSNSFSILWTIYITYMAGLKKADVEVISS